MKIRFLPPDYKRDPRFQALIDQCVAELKKVPKRPSSTVQCASTQAILDRPISEDAKRRAQINDPQYWADLAERSKADRYYQRDIPIDQMLAYESMRRKSKNELGTLHLSSLMPERKEAAINAFTYSQPAPLTPDEIAKVTKVEPINHIKELSVSKTTLWGKIKKLFKKEKQVTMSHYDRLVALDKIDKALDKVEGEK